MCFEVINSMGHLGETINHHLEKYRNQMPEVIKKIENSLYVDNLSTGADDPKGSIELCRKINICRSQHEFEEMEK